VVVKLDLHEQKEQPQKSASAIRSFLSEVKASIRLKENIDTLTGKDRENTEPGNRMDKAVNKLKSRIKVKEVPDTMLYEISVADPDPVFARNAANTLARTYIEFDIANRVKYSKNSFQWMSDQFYEVKKKLEDTERDFLNYKEDEKLFSVEGRQDEILNKIREANNSYIETRNERMDVESKLKELNSLSTGSKDDIRPAISLLNSSLLNSLYNQLIEAEMEKTRLSKVFKEKHPKMIQINSGIDDITETIREEIDKEKSNLDAGLIALKSKEKVYQKTAEDYEGEALGINRKQLQYTILGRNVETNQRLHDTILAKLKEADITDTMVVSNIRIAEEATRPKSPFKPNKKRNFLLSMIVGLMIGIGLAFLRENIDRTIQTEDDVQRSLGLTVLSVIPKAEKATEDSYGQKKGER
jgi:succinoglycan biosynthesis transport protein ExoP